MYRRIVVAAALVALAPPLAAAAPATAATTITLTVDATAARHAISPLIYGVNFSSQVSGLTKVFKPTVDRWGGNATSRYNYLNHMYNTGSDWYFENIQETGSSTLESQVSADRANGAASLVTVPMIGWVAKATSTQHPYACSFPKTTFANQDSYDYWDPNCGNGTTGGYATTLTADPTLTSSQAGPEFDAAMASWLVGRYGKASAGGVKLYELDNEPTLWNSTHRDVHPAAVGADELWTKSKATAAALKSADATAQVLGPSDWGWCAYYFSAKDNCGQSTADQRAHGSLPLGAWYLKQFAAADASSGRRTLDYFDEHYYPAEDGVANTTAGSAATQALRLRSTRSLWDPTYTDESWIGTDVKAKPLQWIRTMKAWTSTYYPGTKTAISEYNFGGLESMNGALTQADVLGIFGREGLDLATLWGPGTATQPWAYAFAMYRNYDGKGHAFGRTSVSTRSSDQGRLAAYGATRSDGALTVMVINKTSSAITSTLGLSHFAGSSRAGVYRYSAAKPRAIVHAGTARVSSRRTVKVSYPASSITLLVIGKA